MKIVTSQVLINKYGPPVLDMVKRLGTDVEVLPTNNCYDAKKYIDGISDDILIFGGPDIIQFFTLLNPANDPDNTVLSDAPYACTNDLSNLVPNKVVARLPDEQINATIDFIDKVTTAQMGFLTIPVTPSSWFNIVASVWKGISDFMVTTFKMDGNQHVVPPVTFDNLPEVDILGRKFAYINLHGGKNTPFFYGQQNGIYPVALKPRLGDFKNTLIFSEACYGCYFDGRDKTMSIPLMALYSGAIGFVGSTEVAYGPSSAPARCADLLALKFYNHIIAGESIGEAFLNAKIDFATQTIQSEGSLDPESKKTLLSFNLFATPIVKV
jgi:hypothetical protein